MVHLPMKLPITLPRLLNGNTGELMQTKLTNLYQTYERVMGLDEVKVLQGRVIDLQNDLLNAQEQRRHISHSLLEIRQQAARMQEELMTVRRQDEPERFLQLMKAENNVILEEQEQTRRFQCIDQQERELFTAFTDAVRASYEKQRSQLESSKYLGIILSITGSFLAFCYTSMRKSDLKRFIEQKLQITAPPVHVSIDHDVLTDVIQTELKKVVNVNMTADYVTKDDLNGLLISSSGGGGGTVVADQQIDESVGQDIPWKNYAYTVLITILILKCIGL